MLGNKINLLISISTICLALICCTTAYKGRNMEQNLNAFKPHSITEVTDTLEYVNTTNKESKIYYHTLKTTYYEADPIENTNLNTNALNVLFPVADMESCEKMRIQNWNAALYKKGDTAYLCWTCSPRLSYVLEYNPNLIDDSEIIETAESARPKP